jgi:hypothetical protein
MEPMTPLSWSYNGQAVKVYKVPGTLLGDNTFDLTNWTEGSGGEWENWFVEQGELFREPGLPAPDCALATNIQRPVSNSGIRISPTLVDNQTTVFLPGNEEVRIEVLDQNGRILFTEDKVRNEITLDCRNWLSGLYFVKVSGKDDIFTARFIIP